MCSSETSDQPFESTFVPTRAKRNTIPTATCAPPSHVNLWVHTRKGDGMKENTAEKDVRGICNKNGMYKCNKDAMNDSERVLCTK